MATMKITDVQVWNQNGEDATLFNPYIDAISLAVGVDLSADLTANLDMRYFVDFQLIEARTNDVVIDSSHSYQLPEDWASWWFTAGNNWARPYTTAQRWGLWWPSPAIFGFRAILTAAFWEGNKYITVDAFDVSAVRWFQLLPVVKID
jgi:hypothetical protein